MFFWILVFISGHSFCFPFRMSLRKEHLLKNVHQLLQVPEQATDVHLVKGEYTYYHYGCDGMDDFGWGCGFRVLQTICSWIDPKESPISINAMIATLDDIADPSWNSERSKRPWIGAYEAFLIIDTLYDVVCRIVHLPRPSSFTGEMPLLQQHFDDCGSPVFLGGDQDCYGKCILGTCRIYGRQHILVLDPHFPGKLDNLSDILVSQFMKWTCIDDLQQDSFYNILLPLSHGELGPRFRNNPEGS